MEEKINQTLNYIKVSKSPATEVFVTSYRKEKKEEDLNQ